jgi:Ca-activated chloride channel family protein
MRLLSVLPLIAAPAIAAAQGMMIPRCPTPRPDMRPIECVPDRRGVERTRSDVKVELRDGVLRYEVEERFINHSNTIGEADYVFPLPAGAAFRDLKLSIDGQLVAGETMNAADARRIYEDIVRRQKDPALVEWLGHGMLRTRIFPFNPGEERRIVVRFESVARREGDAVRVDYFRGSRLSALGSDRPNQSREPRAETRFALNYRAGGELGEPYSPTHELDIERDGVTRRVNVRSGGGDVTVLVSLRRSNAASVALLANARRDEPGYALITVTPPADVAGARLPRDVTMVIDVSGSMAGRKMDQAKAAGRQLLRTLGDQDRFRLIDFGTDVRSFRDGFTFATPENLRAAERYLENLEATGSTNISGALEEALGSRPSAGSEEWDGREPKAQSRERLRLVLFMTDGAATVGDRDPISIAARAARMRGDARIFTFGIGQDVNIGLIEQLAIEGRGTPHFVRQDENVERVVGLVAAQLRQPLLTNVRVTIDGNVRLSRMYPTSPIDVFAGEDLVLLARYEGHGRANVVVEGRAGGRNVRWSTERVFPDEEFENVFVPRLWATQRIGWLSSEKRKNGGNSEINDEIRKLGERFGIPTEFTSYLVLEPGMVAQGQRRDVRFRDQGAIGNASGAGAPSAAPAAATFEAARSAAAQRAVKSVAAADMNSSAELAGTSGDMKKVGGKLFKREGELWTDAAMKTDLKVYKVKAYSQSYFSLLERIPALREAFSAGDRVLVAGRTLAVEVDDDAKELTDAEISAVVKGW